MQTEDDLMKAIDSWLKENKLDINKGVGKAEYYITMRQEDIQELEPAELLEASNEISGYADYINDCASKLKAIVNYANSSINMIVSPLLDQYGDNYVKYEKKYNMAIKENPLASKLFQLKLDSELKYQCIENKANFTKAIANIFMEFYKRKVYGQRNTN